MQQLERPPFLSQLAAKLRRSDASNMPVTRFLPRDEDLSSSRGAPRTLLVDMLKRWRPEACMPKDIAIAALYTLKAEWFTEILPEETIDGLLAQENSLFVQKSGHNNFHNKEVTLFCLNENEVAPSVTPVTQEL